MKNAFHLFLFILLLGLNPKLALADWYQTRFQLIDSLQNEGLPRETLPIFDSIYQKAFLENNNVMLVRSIAGRNQNIASLEEEPLVSILIRINSDLPGLETPVKQIVHSLLAEIYQGYYEQNRWRFNERTTLNNPKGNDIRFWDLERLNSEMLQQLDLSLAESKLLKDSPIDHWGTVLEGDSTLRSLRPTLFDLLAHRALDIIRNPETGLTKPSDSFDLNQVDLFSPGEQFANMNLTTCDTLSLHYKTMELFRQLTRFRLEQGQAGAITELEMNRIAYLTSHNTHPKKDSLTVHFYEHLLEKDLPDESKAEVAYRLALFYFNQQIIDKKNKLGNSLQLCNKTLQLYPQTKAAHYCQQLKDKIEEPYFSIIAEAVELPKKPFRVLISWKNIGSVKLKIHKINSKQVAEYQYRANTLGDTIKTHTAFREWEQALPVIDDFSEHKAEIAIEGLPEGFYLLSAWHNSGEKKNTVQSIVLVQVSSTALLSKNMEKEELFLVSKAETGEPLDKAIIELYLSEYKQESRKWEYKKEHTLLCNQKGEAFFKLGLPKNYLLKVIVASDTLVVSNQYFGRSYRDETEQKAKSITFYTDRAIYRPGQIVQFKAIVLEKEDEKFSVVPKFSTEVSLKDANFEEVTSLQFVSNEYGTFSGSFTLPQNGLNGVYYLNCEHGNTSFRVEEYRRPTFEVLFDTLGRTYSFGDTVVVCGTVKTLSGSPVDAAKISYHITRREQAFRWWWRPALPDMVIASNTTVADSDGRFLIRFPALASDLDDRNRVMVYHVQIEATDSNGETRTHYSETRISNNNLLIECNLPDIIPSSDFKGFDIKTTNLNGHEVPSKLVLSICKIEAPGNIFSERYWETPDTTIIDEISFKKKFPNYPYREENNTKNWKKGKILVTQTTNLPYPGKIKPDELLLAKPGYYLIELDATSPDGKQKSKRSQIIRLLGNTPSKAEQTEDWVTAIKTHCQPGKTAEIWLTGLHPKTPIRYELVKDRETLKSEIITPGKEVYQLLIPIEERYRGNVSARFIQIANNRRYIEAVEIEVPHSDKKINIAFTTFRDQLLPGKKEQWGLTLTDHTSKGLSAEMVATLYDASLDQFTPHNWAKNFYHSGSNYDYRWKLNLLNRLSQNLFHPASVKFPEIWVKEYETLPLLNFNPGGYNHLFHSRGKSAPRIMIRGARKAAETNEEVEEFILVSSVSKVLQSNAAGVAMADNKMTDVPDPSDEIDNEEEATKNADFSQVQLRTNFNETAFFYPHLYSDNEGKMEISFTMPEAITRWRMMGFAHTQDFKTGSIEKELVTRKLVSVSAYAPRFLRENDTLNLSAKVTNLTDSTLNGVALLQWTDAVNFNSLTSNLIQGDSLLQFEIAPQSSAAVNWKMIVPQGLQAATYKVMAKTATHSDGEQKTIPVLTNRQLVTESLPFMVRGGETKKVEFSKMANHGSTTLTNHGSASLTNNSASLTQHSYTVEYTSNPAWYAIQSLPYLMEYPYECAEQLFSRFYANATASALVNSSPRIKAVFDSWKMADTGAFLSNLEKNSELKSVLLEESPWVLSAKNESEAEQRIGLLFDLNRMGNELDEAFNKLKKMQGTNGGFPWFSGMPDNRYITQHIAKGLGEMKQMNLITPKWETGWDEMRSKAMTYLDAHMVEDYKELLKQKEKNSTLLEKLEPSVLQIHYLYTRSFYPNEVLTGETKIAFDYYFKQAQKYWLSYSEYAQGLLALTCHRFGDATMAKKIVKSLANRAISSKEDGMYWKNNRWGYFWHQSPIETQALLINVFAEITKDTNTVEEMKIWLLRNKQTTHWKTTKATLAACYALLSQGYDLLGESRLLQVKLGGKPLEEIRELKPEAGTGYVKTVFTKNEITPEMAQLTITNPNRGVAWGAAYWQYFEQLDKITTARTDVEIRKQLYIKEKSESGQQLNAITTDFPIKIGDEVVVRVEIRSLRDMEYVHLKDLRAAGFEPTSTLSEYKWQDGLGYYQEVKDAAVNFFIAFLPKGTYVFEYSLRASHTGQFSNGITTFQCMYAPEFNTHSEGKRVIISQ